MSEEAKWYVVHTYSGYENKVKVNIEKLVENRSLHDFIIDIKIPMEDVTEIKTTDKGTEKKIVKRKLYPGYVIIKMIMNDDIWYLVKNTRGVTGFVGMEKGTVIQPIPLTDEEVIAMGVEVPNVKVDYYVGDSVRMTMGAFENSIGIIEEINLEKQKVKVLISMFNREIPIEINLDEIEVI